MGYNGGGDGFVDGAVEADDAFLFVGDKSVKVSKLKKGRGCGGGGGGQEGGSFIFCCLCRRGMCVYVYLPLGVGRRCHLFGVFFSHLSPFIISKRQVWWVCFRGGLEHLRVRQPPPWHGQHLFENV